MGSPIGPAAAVRRDAAPRHPPFRASAHPSSPTFVQKASLNSRNRVRKGFETVSQSHSNPHIIIRSYAQNLPNTGNWEIPGGRRPLNGWRPFYSNSRGAASSWGADVAARRRGARSGVHAPRVAAVASPSMSSTLAPATARVRPSQPPSCSSTAWRKARCAPAAAIIAAVQQWQSLRSPAMRPLCGQRLCRRQ